MNIIKVIILDIQNIPKFLKSYKGRNFMKN